VCQAWFRGQLPPEVRHASEITHPGVCKIFEIHTVTGRHGTLDFLTMEFLDGETLADRLLRGPLTRTESQEIAQQLCAAVAEAHRSGVIHGDLKSNNVILTKSSDGGIRAVITDFGLARGLKANLGSLIQLHALSGREKLFRLDSEGVDLSNALRSFECSNSSTMPGPTQNRKIKRSKRFVQRKTQSLPCGFRTSSILYQCL